MATLRDIKASINTVGNIGKITKAMQLVAAAKLNKAQERAHTIRPYADEMDGVLGTLATLAGEEGGDALVEMAFDEEAPLVTTREKLFAQHEVKRPAVVLITSDRGLCGAFNTNLIRAASKFLEETPGCRLITLGRKGYQFFKRRTEVVYHREGIDDKLNLAEVKEITGKLVELYLTDEVDAVYLLYAKSTGTASYRITTQKFLSIPPVEGGGDENYIMSSPTPSSSSPP